MLSFKELSLFELQLQLHKEKKVHLVKRQLFLLLQLTGYGFKCYESGWKITPLKLGEILIAQCVYGAKHIHIIETIVLNDDFITILYTHVNIGLCKNRK